MEIPDRDIDANDYFRTTRGATALGLAYLLVGIGLLTSFAVNSTAFFIAVLVAILVVSGISLYIIVRSEGVLTRANQVIGVFVLLSLGLLLGLYEYTELPTAIVFGIVIAVGAILPNLILEQTSLGG